MYLIHTAAGYLEAFNGQDNQYAFLYTDKKVKAHVFNDGHLADQISGLIDGILEPVTPILMRNEFDYE